MGIKIKNFAWYFPALKLQAGTNFNFFLKLHLLSSFKIRKKTDSQAKGG